MKTPKLFKDLVRCHTCGSPFIELPAWAYFNDDLHNDSEGCGDNHCSTCESDGGYSTWDDEVTTATIREWVAYRKEHDMDSLETEELLYLAAVAASAKRFAEKAEGARAWLAKNVPNAKRTK